MNQALKMLKKITFLESTSSGLGGNRNLCEFMWIFPAEFSPWCMDTLPPQECIHEAGQAAYLKHLALRDIS